MLFKRIAPICAFMLTAVFAQTANNSTQTLPEAAAAVATPTSVWAFRSTESISNTDQHTVCKVHQGPDMTLVQCPSQYELYQTPLLAKSRRGETQKNYGATKTVVGVHNSFQEKKQNRLTYLESPNNVKEIRIEHNRVSGNKELKDRTLLQLPQDSAIHKDIYVFDDLVITKVSTGDLRFYARPLSGGSIAQRLEFLNQGAMVASSTISADVLETNSTTGEVYYFASTKDKVYVHVFMPDYKYMNLTMSVQEYSAPELNGSKQKMAATKDMLVISCADCTQPGLHIYNKRTLSKQGQKTASAANDLKANAAFFQKMYSVKLAALTNGDYYTLEVNDTPDIGYSQIFVASNNTISLVERQIARNDDLKYRQNINIFKSEQIGLNKPHPIHMGKSDNYLVFKETQDQRLNIMPICSPYARFDNATFTCIPCEQNTRSFGRQDPYCQPCLEMRTNLKDDDFEFYLFQRVCRDEGFLKSVTLVTVWPVMVTLLACLCCCLWTPTHEQWLAKLETNRKRRAGQAVDKDYEEDLTCCGLWKSSQKNTSKQSEVDEARAALQGNSGKPVEGRNEFDILDDEESKQHQESNRDKDEESDKKLKGSLANRKKSEKRSKKAKSQSSRKSKSKKEKKEKVQKEEHSSQSSKNVRKPSNYQAAQDVGQGHQGEEEYEEEYEYDEEVDQDDAGEEQEEYYDEEEGDQEEEEPAQLVGEDGEEEEGYEYDEEEGEPESIPDKAQ